VQVSVKETIRL